MRHAMSGGQRAITVRDVRHGLEAGEHIVRERAGLKLGLRFDHRDVDRRIGEAQMPRRGSTPEAAADHHDAASRGLRRHHARDRSGGQNRASEAAAGQSLA